MNPGPSPWWLIRKKGALAVTAAMPGAALLGLVSCCGMHAPQHCDQDKAHFSREYFKQERDKSFTLAWPTVKGEHPVYRCTEGSGNQTTAAERPVLLLHEYDRLSGSTLDFAERLSKQGFTVYVPLLFGRAEGGRGGWPLVRNTLELVFSREWNVVGGVDEHQPITDWLEKVCQRISNLHPHKRRGVAVIGMCLTGAFPIALMNQECVIAAVLAQPSAPLLCVSRGAEKTPGISRKELQDAGDRARRDNIDVFWTRYEADTISRSAKFKTISEAFGSHLKDHTIQLTLKEQREWGLTNHAHATLTLCFHDNDSPDYPPRILFKDLLAYLDRQFQRHGSLSESIGQRANAD